jgi:uncharacterized protein (TIGR03083 family)
VDEITSMVISERKSLAGFLDTLSPEQWSTPTWCDKWNVQQLVAHLVAAGQITFFHFAGGFVKKGFNFSKFVEGDLVQYSQGSPSEVLQRFNGIVESTRHPPGPKYVALGEVMAHGEDIRRSLGAKGEHPAVHLATLAEAYRSTGAPLHGKRRTAGSSMKATDVAWSGGEGPEVSGPAMSLILAMVGRRGALDDLAGPGLDTLRARM